MSTRFLKRIFSHLFIFPSTVSRRFPKDALRRIEAAITASEAMHSGEIRFAVELNLPIFDVLSKKSAKQRAIEVFSQLHVWDTEQNNGVLIYLLMADHDFEILADRSIHHHAGNQVWEHICQEMESLFRQGRFEAGVLHGISKISELLVKHYPVNGPNENELPNAPIII